MLQLAWATNVNVMMDINLMPIIIIAMVHIYACMSMHVIVILLCS